MDSFKFYDRKRLEKFISHRAGETKLGEKLVLISDFANLHKRAARFVIFGIPEDIGVRANYGEPGTAAAWELFLSAFCNVQHNQYLDAENIILAGEIKTSEEMRKAENIDVADPNYHEKLGDLVKLIDEKVSEVVKQVVSSGKIPVIIGGGHNNAFGNLKGASEALGKPINVLNIDAHTDLRSTNYRHSGNGFSTALKNGFLERYSVYGLHQNYTPHYIFEEMENSANLHFSLFDELGGEGISGFHKHLEFVRQEEFGMELDCDAIANFPSSAVSPSGFSLEEVRELLKMAAKEKKCIYLHICEASGNGLFPTGKSLSFLVTDFLKHVTNA